MDFLIKFTTIWFSLSVVFIATGWYLSTQIKPLCPHWWRQHIVADAEDYRLLQSRRNLR